MQQVVRAEARTGFALVEIALLAGDMLAARVTLAFQDLVHTALIYTEGCRNDVLIFALPVAEPDIDGVITTKLVGRIFHFLSLLIGPKNLTEKYLRVVCACYRYRSASFPRPLRFDREAEVLAGLGFSRPTYMQ